MYQLVCDEHEFITVTLTSTGGQEKVCRQCRRCGANDEEKSLAETDKELIDFACDISMRTILELIKDEEKIKQQPK